jgi:superfamily I DNA/RNA helicase
MIKLTLDSNRMVYNGYEITEEQQHAVDCALYGSQKINACAGSGKTSTCGAISKALARHNGLYVAFNKAIATEAQRKMPCNVSARTAHSLAFIESAIPYSNAGKMSQRLYPTIIANEMNISAIAPLTRIATASVILETVNRYCYSDAEEISNWHVGMRDFLDYSDADQNLIRETIKQYARQLWQRMEDLNDKMPITHDFYLKKWALSRPFIGVDFILFDEAQDANPVLTDVITNQSHANIIIVGDRYQQIYSWRGARNAMQSVDLPESQLTKSFRFGQSVADVANHILNNQINANVDIKGFENIDSTIKEVEQSNCIISRTNANVIKNVFSILDNNLRPHVVGGTRELLSLVKAIETLKEGKRTNHADLRTFESYDELLEYSKTDHGKDIAKPLDMIDKYGYLDLEKALNKTNKISDQDCDVVLTTAHKSKGLEWDNVRLDSDFRPMQNKYGQPNKQWSEEEANLLYVAATRAINNLDCSRVKDIAELCKPIKNKEVA